MRECEPGCRHAGQEKHPAECEPRVTVGDLCERGGYLPSKSRALFRLETLERDVAELRVRQGLPEHARPPLGPTPAEMQSRMDDARRRLMADIIASEPYVVGPRLSDLPVSTPAAMLGEALGLVERAATLLVKSGHYKVGASALGDLAEVHDDVEQLRRGLLKREAEAREGRTATDGMAESSRMADEQRRAWVQKVHSDSARKALCSPGELADLIRAGREVVQEQRAACPAVNMGALFHRLGGAPEACLVCAAKRAEETARGQG